MNKAKAPLVYLTPLVVFMFSLRCEQILAADAEKAAEKKSGEAKTSFFISTANIVPSNVQPATSGVKLLEGIFLKLRNQPQLAFGSSRAQNLLQSAIVSHVGSKDVASSTDQLLAIRPAERSARGFRFDYAANEFPLENPSGHLENPSEHHGSARFQSTLRAKAPSPMAKVQVKPLGTSIQNLAGAAGALQELAQASESENVKSYGALANQNARQIQMKVAGDRAFANERGQLVASAPLITEFRSTTRAGDLKHFAADAQAKKIAMSPAAPSLQSLASSASAGSAGEDEVSAVGAQSSAAMAPLSPGLFKNIREIGKQEKFSNGSGIKQMFDEPKTDKADSFDKKQIALLPPSIVSGVPLVHLGASALQIKESLGSKVKIDKQIIEDWTVWSVAGRNGGECALQLYFRHGIVEAIRVFDTSYLGADLGIKLGSDLQTIKEKFGEPAFILPEPLATRGVEAGKNYIYPISQVSFALARSRDRAKPAPKVVSMLIFNVK